MKYEAVIFDVFGTLVDNVSLQEHRRMLTKMASVLSLDSDEFIKLWSNTSSERIKGIVKDYRENIEYICKQVGLPIEDKQIELSTQIRFDMIQSEMVPRVDAINILSNLKSEGYKTGLISNCTYEATIVWESTPFPTLIDVAVFSCLEGLQKPDPLIYQISMQRLGVEAHNCLYIIGDGSSHELTGAAQAGMYPVLVRDPYEDSTDVYRVDAEAEEWGGPVITSLKEVLTLVR